MSDVNANIGVHFDTTNALAELRKLQAGLSRFNQSLTEGNIAATNAQKGLNAQLLQSINATGKFVASQKTITSSTASFTDALEKNKLSMGQYFKYTSAAASLNSKMLQGFFTKEKEILNRASKDRVKALQTQYIQLTNANGELVKVLQVVPKHLQMVNGQYTDYATRVQMAAQRQQLMNQLLKQGSTQLLNFGKNTQWAGRQLMVGLTIPLMMLGSTAAKAFRDMEQATVKFQRVYGDMTTGISDTNKAVEGIKALAQEFTKFGIAATDTMNMAADAAAMGLTGSALQLQVTNATKLAVLGQVSQQDALQTTISLQNAFGISSEQLAQKINFLNAVENQTVLSIADLTTAIPKAGPVIKQLGGSVEDLAFFMTAMKEGGINASEGANALKSGLASLINPSKKASDFLAGLGVNIKGIVEANAGDLKGTIVGVARALDTLAPLERSRAIEQLFGKFQFARISTLFQNITKEGSQASRAFRLAGASVEELAILSERELGKVENAVGVKFQKQIENLKIQLMPIGKAFLQAVTPIVSFAGKMLEKFNNLGEGTKKFVIGFIAVLGGIAPAVLMTVGLVANGAANLIKFFAMLRGGMAKLNGQNNVLGGGFDYLTQSEIENLTQSQALHTSHKNLIETFNVEATSVNLLATAYANAASQARSLASGSPGLFNANPGSTGAVSGIPKKFADGGVVVAGSGTGDTVPAMLTPGETVLTAQTSKKYGPLINAIMGDKLPGYAKGKRGITGDQEAFISQTARVGSSQPGVADEMAKQLEFINKASADKLLAYAKATGKVVSDSSAATLEELRKSLVSDVKKVFTSVAETAKTKGKELTVSAIKSSTKRVGSAGEDFSLHEFYNPRAHQQQSTQFGHAETSSTVRADQLSQVAKLTDTKAKAEAEAIVNAINAHNIKTGDKVEMPKTTPVSGFGYDMTGEINKAMNDAAMQLKDGTSTIDAFMKDFKDRGIEKWRKSVEIGGGNFEKLSSSIKMYDDKILQSVQAWKTANPGKAFTDTEFMKIEQTVRSEVLSVGNGLGAVFEEARNTVTAVRLKLTKVQRDILNADAIARGEVPAGTAKYATDRTTYQMGGTERRNSKGMGKFTEQTSQDLTAAEKIAETASPSKRTKRLGKNIGKGLEDGLAESADDVSSQSEKLVRSAVPTDQEIEAARIQTQKNAVKSAKSSAKKASRVRNAVDNSKASTDVLEADKENAKISKKIVDSKKESLNTSEQIVSVEEGQIQGTITAAELTQATSLNLENSANNIEQINDAQQNILESSIESSDLENNAVDEKRKQVELLRKYNAEMAASVAEVQIPVGSQTNGINPATALNSVEAYKEASMYTRNKKGQILFDPETGEPTTLTAKQISQKKRGMRREKVGRYSGKTAGTLGTVAMVAGMAGAPAPVTASLGAASMLAQFAPMIAGMGSIGIGLTALTAVGGGLYLFNKRLTDMSKAAAEFAASTVASTKKMQEISLITGKVGSVELMQKKAPNIYNQYSAARERRGQMFGDTFLQSDVGKAFQSDLVQQKAKLGAKETAKNVAQELAIYISDGIMTAEQANSVADQIGINLKDRKFSIDIQGNLLQIVGPNGSDLTRAPLQTRIKIIKNAQDRSSTSAYEASSGKSAATGQDLTRDQVRQAAASMNTYDSKAIGIAAAQADATQREYDDKILVLQKELDITTNKERQLDLQKQISALRDKEAADLAVINNELSKNIQLAISNYNALYGNTNAQDSVWDALRSQLNVTYKNNADELAAVKVVLDDLEKIKNDPALAGFFSGGSSTGSFQVPLTRPATVPTMSSLDPAKAKAQAAEMEKFYKEHPALDPKNQGKVVSADFALKMAMFMNEKVMSADQEQTLIKMYSGDLMTANAILDYSIKEHGALKTATLFNTFGGFEDKSLAKKLTAQVVVQKNTDFDNTMKAMDFMATLDGHEINMEIFLKQPGNLEAITKSLAEIWALENPIKKDVVIAMDKKNNGEFKALLDNWETYYSKLPDDVRKQAIATYDTIYRSTVIENPEAKKKWAEEWAAAQALMVSQDTTSILYQKTLKTNFEYAMGTTAAQEADIKTQTVIGSLDYINSITKNAKSTSTSGTKTDPYADLMKHLRNIRLAALNAAGGFKELEKAIASSGSKAINNQFNGLEQQLIKLGKTTQFTEYLAGLDQKELNTMGKVATKAGIDPNTGKKKKGIKTGDFVLNDKGQKMEKGFNKAIIGDYNKEYLKSVTLQKQEIAARTKLLSMGFDQADIQAMIADENYRTLIATGKVTDAELKTNAALTTQERIRSKISNLFNKGKNADLVAQDQKRIPEVVKMMQEAGVNAESIRAAISDPEMLNQLITGMDAFATASQDVRDNFNEALRYIDEIPDRKIIELVYTQTDAQKTIAGADAASEMFDVYKNIDENTLTNAEGNTYASLQTQMDNLNNQAKIAQDAINLTQSKIDTMQQEVDKDQRAIEANFTRPIEQKQKAIEKLNRTAEMNFVRPIQALQDRSNILSHDLEVMSHAADKINEKYDLQQEALTKVAEINQQIIEQQQQQLGLADALTQGDIAAAAKAAQVMRASNASNYANSAEDALAQARQNEINGLRGGVSGKSQKDIQEEQYQIGLQTYDLERGKAEIDKQILAIQDEIYTLEQSRQVALDAIQVKTDAIAALTYGTLLDQQNALKAITDQILPLQSQSDLLAKIISDNDKNRIISGKTREEWELTKKAAEAAQKLAAGDLALALAAAEDVSGKIKGSWDSIRDAYDAIKSKKIEILQYIKTIQGPMPTTEPETNTNTTTNAVQTGNGPDAKADAALAAKYAQIAKDTANDDQVAKRAAAAAREAAAAKAQAAWQVIADRKAKYGYLSSGGIVPKYFASGGFALGTDTVPAMLTPGEFVMSRYAVNSHGVDTMKAINSGAKTSAGDSVYNYNLNVSVKSDASPDEIARTVMAQIKQVDSQRLRGNRF